MAPTRRMCTVLGCDGGTDGGAYVTLESNHTNDQAMTDLSLHLEIHRINGSAKVPKMDQPSLQEDCMDVYWDLFMKQLYQFKRSMGVSGQTVIDQLWMCLSGSLEKAVNNDGATYIKVEVDLLLRIHKLAVKGQTCW